FACRHAPSGPTATKPIVVRSSDEPPPPPVLSASASPSPPPPHAPSARAATMAADVARRRRDLVVLVSCSFPSLDTRCVRGRSDGTGECRCQDLHGRRKRYHSDPVTSHGRWCPACDLESRPSSRMPEGGAPQQLPPVRLPVWRSV